MMEATALCAVLIIPSQVKKSNKCLWLAGCVGAVLVPASVKHNPFSPWGISEESWLMCWWLRGLFLMQEPQNQELCHSTHQTPWPGEGWWKAAGLCWPGADFLFYSEVWCCPKGSWDNLPLGFPGAAMLSLRRAGEGARWELLLLWWWEVRGMLGSVSPGDCQGSSQLQGPLTSGTAGKKSRFSSTFLLHYENRQILGSLPKMTRVFFHKEKQCSTFNQHFPGILFLVLTSVQQCRMEGSLSFSLICYFHITWAWPPSLVSQSLNRVWNLAAIPDLW